MLAMCFQNPGMYLVLLLCLLKHETQIILTIKNKNQNVERSEIPILIGEKANQTCPVSYGKTEPQQEDNLKPGHARND